MIKKRIKISAVYNHFTKEIRSLRNFDSNNQTNFQNGNLTIKQIHILVEAVFFNAFREYENFIRDIFLLYCQEKTNANGDKIKSYLNPKDFFHTEKLIQSSMNVVDWNSPDTIIERSELFLKDGFPVKTPYTTNKNSLTNFKLIRNHIAHNSSKSLQSFKKILRIYYGVNPLTIPSVGEYLLLSSRVNHQNYNLLDFFDLLEEMAENLK